MLYEVITLGKSRFLFSGYRQIEGTLLTVERILLIALRKLATRLAPIRRRLFHLDLKDAVRADQLTVAAADALV